MGSFAEEEASDVLWLEAAGSEKAGSRLFRRGDVLNGCRQVGFLFEVPRRGEARMERGKASVTAKY